MSSVVNNAILFLIAIFSLTTCAIHDPHDRFDYTDNPVIKREAITFSGYYLPPTVTPLLHEPVTDKNNYRFKIISRELLDVDASEAPAFGYYAYLVFTDQSEATYPMRKAAAQAFMCQFQEPEQYRLVGLSIKNNAVLYVPINPGTVSDIRKYKSGDALLNNYNYPFAQALVNKIKHMNTIENFAVGIIAHPEPLVLENQGTIVKEGLKIISLDDMPPAQIGAVIRKLRQAVLDKDHITALRVPENSETVDYPLFIDVTVDNFSAIFRTTLQSIQNLMPQVETAEAAAILCH